MIQDICKLTEPLNHRHARSDRVQFLKSTGQAVWSQNRESNLCCETISFYSSLQTVWVTRLSAGAVCRKTSILCQHRPLAPKKWATRLIPDLTSAWRGPPIPRAAPCGAARGRAGLSETTRCLTRPTLARTVIWGWAWTLSAGMRSVRDIDITPLTKKSLNDLLLFACTGKVSCVWGLELQEITAGKSCLCSIWSYVLALRNEAVRW